MIIAAQPVETEAQPEDMFQKRRQVK